LGVKRRLVSQEFHIVEISPKSKLDRIRGLVGPITEEQLRYVDSFVSKEVGLFMPVGGACFYALTPRHSHPGYMFVLAFDDLTGLRLGEKIIAAQPGRLLALSPDIPHHELPSDSPPRYIAVFIDRVFFSRQLRHYPAAQNIRFEGASFDAPPELLPLLKRFIIEADAGLPGAVDVLHGLNLEICHQLIRAALGVTQTNKGIACRVEIDRVVEFLNAHSNRKITVKKMAEQACMSPSHFARTFKKELGLPPMVYLLQLRLRRAKKLLMAGDQSITEIALYCGFSSGPHFSSCFQRQFRISPAQFRNSFNKAE
jgi:AraC family transcriptional regulator